MTEQDVSDDNHRKEMLARLAGQQRSGVLCDVVLAVGDREFPAHKSVLAASSDYFLTLFTTKITEASPSRIVLDALPEVVQDLLGFIYTGRITFSEFNVKDIMMTADYLIISDLKQRAVEFLHTMMATSNCLQIYLFAEQCNCVGLKDIATRFILENFSLVSKTDEFCDIAIELLESLVSNNNIVVSGEEEVYQAVVKWVKHDLYNRKYHFDKLFSQVRLFSISKEYIRDYIEKEPLVNNSVACMNVLVQGLKAFIFQVPGNVLDGDLTPRKCLQKDVAAIVMVGGLPSARSLKTMAYLPEQRTWHQLADMNCERNEHAVVVHSGFLYCIGGYPRGSAVGRFDRLTNTWCAMADLLQRTFAPAAVVWGDKIHVIGGKDGFQAIKTVQTYHPSSNTWSLGPAMRHARKASCTVAFEGHVFAIGGCTNDNNSLNFVEKLNMATNEWTEVSPMRQERKYACAAVLGDKIVVIGGKEGTSSSSLGTCEIYSPRDDWWSSLADVTFPRAAGGVARIGGKVFIVGGRNNGAYVDTVEWYDEQEQGWCVEESVMPFKCAWFQCAPITLPKELVVE